MNAVRPSLVGLWALLVALSAASCSSSDPAPAAPAIFIDAAQIDAGGDAAGDVQTEPPPVPCNMAAPSCPDPAAPKCTVVNTPAGYVGRCLPESGTRAVGESCLRQEVGHDDCAIGALCSTVALAADASSELVCRKLCVAPDQCPETQRCYRFSLGQPEIYGMCVPPCQPLDVDCGTGRHCIFVLDAARAVFAMCDSHGDLPEGAACNTPQECQRDMACVTDQGCRRYCDAARPCATDRVCTDLRMATFPGLGVCLPP